MEPPACVCCEVLPTRVPDMRTNGKEGLDVLEAENPGLIVLDLMMPEMDGFEFLRRLEQHPRHSQLPVIVATAKDLTDAERVILKESASNVIQKLGYSRAELMHLVEQQIRSVLTSRNASQHYCERSPR